MSQWTNFRKSSGGTNSQKMTVQTVGVWQRSLISFSFRTERFLYRSLMFEVYGLNCNFLSTLFVLFALA